MQFVMWMYLEFDNDYLHRGMYMKFLECDMEVGIPWHWLAL
jgi:hypothetical protein